MTDQPVVQPPPPSLPPPPAQAAPMLLDPAFDPAPTVVVDALGGERFTGIISRVSTCSASENVG